MTPEAQRVAIYDYLALHMAHCTADDIVNALQEPTEALWACHEMEKVLGPAELIHYCAMLTSAFNGRVCLIDRESLTDSLWSNHALCRIGHATAAQRCEAFLKILNLWDDSK